MQSLPRTRVAHNVRLLWFICGLLQSIVACFVGLLSLAFKVPGPPKCPKSWPLDLQSAQNHGPISQNRESKEYRVPFLNYVAVVPTFSPQLVHQRSIILGILASQVHRRPRRCLSPALPEALRRKLRRLRAWQSDGDRLGLLKPSFGKDL